MYVDKLDGRIDGSFYTQMSEQWRTEQDKIAREIARHRAADRSHPEEGAKLVELAHGAQRLFVKQEAQEQRWLLNFVLSNSIWKEGELTATFRQPSNLIAETIAAASEKEGGGGPNLPWRPAWLGETWRQPSAIVILRRLACCDGTLWATCLSRLQQRL